MRGLDVLLIACVLGLLFPRDAAAYLDPGAGSMVFQTVIAAVAAAGYGVRLYWGRIRGFFGAKAVRPDGAQDPQTPPSY